MRNVQGKVNFPVLHCYIWCRLCSRFSQRMFYFQWNIIRIKFKIFLAMTSLFSGRRSPALVYLSPDCVYFYNSRCVFYISKLLKASHPKSHQHPAKSKAYARGYVQLHRLSYILIKQQQHNASYTFLLVILPHPNQCHQ